MRRRRVGYLTDVCTCDHERREHNLGSAHCAMGWLGPPNFGRFKCQHAGCECPLFVKAQTELAQRKRLARESAARQARRKAAP